MIRKMKTATIRFFSIKIVTIKRRKKAAIENCILIRYKNLLL